MNRVTKKQTVIVSNCCEFLPAAYGGCVIAVSTANVAGPCRARQRFVAFSQVFGAPRFGGYRYGAYLLSRNLLSNRSISMYSHTSVTNSPKAEYHSM